jgi:hypothetical protein
MAMTEQQRAPRSDVIDILVPIGVEDMGALSTSNENRVAAHSAKRTHR